jgi:hypothetical protein
MESSIFYPDKVILHAVNHKGFTNKWISWIESILKSSTSSILLNGVPSKVFYCRRGVRQGDSLSSLLFVLAADLLQPIINKAMTWEYSGCSFMLGILKTFLSHNMLMTHYCYGTLSSTAHCSESYPTYICSINWFKGELFKVKNVPNQFEQ